MSITPDLNMLKEPFKSCEIEWRVQQSGMTQAGKPWAKVLAYVTNRAIMDRLDTVFGAMGWRNEFQFPRDKVCLCGITVFDGEKEVTRWDGAEETNVEAFKGGISSAMKRCAVQFGIGRYLYKLEEGWAVFTDNGKYRLKIKAKGGAETWHKWNPPPLPAWALPGESAGEQVPDDEPKTSVEDVKDIFTNDENAPTVEQRFVNALQVRLNRHEAKTGGEKVAIEGADSFLAKVCKNAGVDDLATWLTTTKEALANDPTRMDNFASQFINSVKGEK